MNDNTSATATYQYHLATYGKDFNYDNFTSNFTDVAFDPKEWVDLIADAGAKYFVPTTSKCFCTSDYNLNVAAGSKCLLYLPI
jgi:alpha-L-fucosidase